MPNPIKVLLLDADGVLIISDRPFSQTHAQENSIEEGKIEPFFRGIFQQATVGKADLQDLIREHKDMWRWDGEPAELLERWFTAESNVDKKLLATVEKLRNTGVKVYLATDQEKYRVAYMRETMFPGMLDGIFVSCELGVEKKDPQFFESVLTKLAGQFPGLTPEEVIFFDDSPDKVQSAAPSGIRAELYTNRRQIEALL